MSSASNSKTNGKPTILDVKLFDVNKLTIDEVDFTPPKKEKGKPDYTATQYISYPKYDGVNSSFKTGWIQFIRDGIPNIGEYYKDDSARDFVKIPIIEEQHIPPPYGGKPYSDQELLYQKFTLQSCKELKNMMMSIDKFMVKNKSKFLGRFAEKFEYQPTLREPSTSNDLVEDNMKDHVERPWFCKFKLQTDFTTKELSTSVFICDGIDESGKAISLRKENVKTVTDLCVYHNWRCVSRYIFRPIKMWAAKSADKKTGKRMYGLTFKIIQLVVKPCERLSGSTQLIEYGFDDDCVTVDDSELNGLTGDTTQEKEEDGPVSETKDQEPDNDSSTDQDSGSEPEPEPEPAPVKKGKAAPVKKPVTKGKGK